MMFVINLASRMYASFEAGETRFQYSDLEHPADCLGLGPNSTQQMSLARRSISSIGQIPQMGCLEFRIAGRAGRYSGYQYLHGWVRDARLMTLTGLRLRSRSGRLTCVSAFHAAALQCEPPIS